MPVSPYKQTIVRLRTDDHTALRTLAEKLDVPAAQLIRQAIREYLDSYATPNSNRAARLDRGEGNVYVGTGDEKRFIGTTAPGSFDVVADGHPQKPKDEMPPDMPDPVHRQVRMPKPDVQPIFRGKDKL